jgi:hypothetical protein
MQGPASSEEDAEADAERVGGCRGCRGAEEEEDRRLVDEGGGKRMRRMQRRRRRTGGWWRKGPQDDNEECNIRLTPLAPLFLLLLSS